MESNNLVAVSDKHDTRRERGYEYEYEYEYED
jgi:hypothetical protein